MVSTLVNEMRIDRDLARERGARYDDYWKERKTHFIAPEIFANQPKIYLEIGAGTGWFFLELAERHPDTFFIAVERDRMRGNRLMHRANRAGLQNVSAHRGNIIPALIHGIPDASLDRIYILYPCPWPKTSHRKNRWYLHPIMPHLKRALKPGGLLIWASDQQFYIEEAEYVSRKKYELETLAFGPLAPNEYNNLSEFPPGRTKFEATFRASGLSCFELVSKKR
jgi:tRNA (guanine-N7-)-methyltransferase